MSASINLSALGVFSYHWNQGIDSDNCCFVRFVKSAAVSFKTLFCGYSVEEVEVKSFFSTGCHKNSVFFKECDKKFKKINVKIAKEKSFKEHTPLMVAAKEGQKENLKALLKSADITHLNEQDKRGFTPLYWATFGGHTDCLIMLLKAGADVNISSTLLRTPLHCAAEKGDEVCVKLLMERPEIDDINCLDIHGSTALHSASRSGNAKCLKELLKHPEIKIDLPDQGNNTPLYHAIYRGDFESVEALLEHKDDTIDVNRQSGLCQMTPLHYAIESNLVEGVNKLLERSDIRADIKDRSGCTPLEYAIEYSISYGDTPESKKMIERLKAFEEKNRVHQY